jgi:predicted RNA binding protein YcfA (HicA-like mRNA interferase family)
MGKYEKLIKRIFEGKSDITLEEAMNILNKLDYKSTPTSGSHRTFRKSDRQSVTIILTQNPLKPYLVEKLQEMLKQEGYRNG